MSTTVQVVLMKDVENLGYTGDIVRVKRGYARNFLVPRGLASVASRANIKQIEHEKALAQARAEKARAAQEEMAKKLEKLVVMVAKQAAEDGTLYGSVSSADVAAGLAHRGVEVDKRKLVMPDEPIKVVGSYEVGLKLGHGVVAAVKVEVKTAA